VVVLAPVLAVLVFSAGVFFGNGPLAQAQAQAAPSASPAASGKDADLALIEEAWRAIQDNYVDAKNLDNQKVAYGAIRGLVAAVGDEGHTSFMTADEVKASVSRWPRTTTRRWSARSSPARRPRRPA